MSFGNGTIVAIGLITSVLSIPPANAGERDSATAYPYVGMNMGYDHYSDEVRSEFVYGARGEGFQYGIRFNEHVRAELGLGRSAAELDNAEYDELSFTRLTLSAHYDFLPTSERFVPYIGGGIGAAIGSLNSDDGDEYKFWFDAYDETHVEVHGEVHGEVGFSLNLIGHSFAIVPSYRYTWTYGGAKLLSDNLDSHAFRIGARFIWE